MRTFNYSAIREQKWDSEILGLVAAIYKEAGKQICIRDRCGAHTGPADCSPLSAWTGHWVPGGPGPA